jgi:transcription elongation factor GreB
VGRWRPASPSSTALITREGHTRLKAELDQLWKERRPEVVKALSAAAAEGDRSENAEYIYRKKQLAEIDRRVRYLSKRLEALRVVQEPPRDRAAIFFGAWFELEAPDGRTHRYRIVGPDEIDARLGYISIDSPLARALLKKRADDEVVCAVPGGSGEFVVLAVSYDGPIGDGGG